jgi:hypothetical protein
MSRARVELRYQRVNQCVEALKPLPLSAHEAVSVVLVIGLNAINALSPEERQRFLPELLDSKAAAIGGVL